MIFAHIVILVLQSTIYIYYIYVSIYYILLVTTLYCIVRVDDVRIQSNRLMRFHYIFESADSHDLVKT